MKKKVLSLALCVIMVLGVLAGCGQSAATENSTPAPAENDSAAPAENTTTETPAVAEKKTIRVGTSAAALEIAKSGVPSLEAMGYEVEVVPFDDFQSPDRALDEKQIDCNFYQHIPFLDNFNSSNGTELVMLEPVMWNYFTGLYSAYTDTIEDIEEGGLIGIAVDASNISLQLQYLRDWGLIELSEKPLEGDYFTTLDITSNPKNLQFISVESRQKFASTEEYAAYTGTSDGLFSAGYDPNENLLVKKTDDRWALGITVRAEDQDSQLAKDLLAAYTSEEAQAYVAEAMGGAYIPADIFAEYLAQAK